MHAFILSPNATTATIACKADHDFAWAKNHQRVPPCLLVEILLSACSTGGNWKIQPLASGLYYSRPTSEDSEINRCACSWAVYNLMSACTACQGFSNSVPSWPMYSAQCEATTDIMFPPQTLADSEEGLAVPFWAAKDPKAWPLQRFNVTQAKAIADEGRPDFLPSGHAVGGAPVVPVVGIVCGLMLAVLFGIGLYLVALLRQSERIYLERMP